MVDAHHLWYVREELRLYPERKQRLTFLETVIVTETPVNETPGIQTGTTSNPTLGRAAALLCDQEVAWLKPRVDLIERVWKKLDPITRRVLNAMVVKHTHTADGTALVIREELKREHYSTTSVYRDLNRGLLTLALETWGPQIIRAGQLPKRQARKISAKSAEVRVLAGLDMAQSL
jgi:hypothetical protein